EIERRGLNVSVVGIPKTIDNDIAVIDKSFGFDTAVEEAQRAINAVHVETESGENGVGLVKLMGRDSEDAGQNLIEEHLRDMEHKDASGNKALLDVGLWLSHNIRDHFAKKKIVMNLTYIDPTYMIRVIPSNASDNVYCTLLVHSAVHGAMAGYSGFTVGPVNGGHAYIPIYRVTEKQNQVCITDRMWARLLSFTNQPSFLSPEDIKEAKSKRESSIQDLQMFLADGKALSEDGNFSATS
ncbi:ATP-dependent 6-phosphofructokinase 3, partial [Nymphaea thermarum]